MNRRLLTWALGLSIGAATLDACKLFGKEDDSEADSDSIDQILGQDRLTFVYGDTPTLGAELTIELVADGDLGAADWRLSEAPAGSAAGLAVTPDGHAVTLTPDLAGDYEITVETTIDGSAATADAAFYAKAELPYDLDHVERDDPDAPLDTVIGAIDNQAWVFSIDGSEDDLRRAVAEYSALTALGYDEVSGLLVGFDPDSADSEAALAGLEATAGIDSVALRIHEGENAPRIFRVPNDGSAFNDGGDNWHLERINAVDAWDDTIGDRKVLVGVTDAGFNMAHEDLFGRFRSVITSRVHDHGMGVAGTIGARTDNGKGISGINWRSRIVAGFMSSDHLFRVARRSGVRVINCSWAAVGYVPTSFSPATDGDARHAVAIQRTRTYRNAALRRFKDTLFVFAAGNGIGNGAGNSAGVYGVDGRFGNGTIHMSRANAISTLDNVIVVAAMVSGDRLTYYSAYGDTVDIAAPTHFKSARSGASNYYTATSYGQPLSGGSFSGTSAAAPVVTGVASLVFSANPDLKADQVKTILIETADGEVTQRYTNPAGATAPLAHPIPIVDAEAAVDAAPDPVLTITVDPPSGLRTGEFAYFDSEIEHGLGPFTRQWNFGDGGTSSLAQDTHAYADARIYTVELTVTDALDREATASVQITVEDGGTVNGDGPTGNEDDFVIWYTGNVNCWGAPLIYITHRDNYEREELRSSFPGGGIDPEEKAEKVIFQAGFETQADAQAWICPQITGYTPHYWCGAHYLIGGEPFQVGALGCDLSGVPKVE